MSHLSPLFPFILHPQNFLKKTTVALPLESEKTNECDSNNLCRTFWDKGPTLETVKTVCKLNDSQASALYHAFTIDHGVALLQGPPGTGKTHTIWALLALLYFYQSSEGCHQKKKILVCAPSNAAIDEVASRVLAQGLPSFDGTHQVIHPLCLRVGHPQRITRPEVLCISLTENVKADGIKAEQTKKQDYSNHRETISNELNAVSTTLQNLPFIQEAQSFQNAFRETTDTEINYTDLKETKNQLFTKKKMLHTQMNRLKQTFREDMKSTKKKCQETCLRETDILFCTLSGSANECLSNLPIDCIIIDEAAQAVELSTLIPLRLEPLRIVLIGDPQQLPATVLSRAAKKLAYERSLFQRLQECGVQSKMLSIQYRMHPYIARFPSFYFYNNCLINAPVVQNRSSLPIHRWKGVFEPFLFFHINSQENRSSSSQSLSNYDEALFIVSLLSLLNKHFNLSAGAQEANFKDSQPTSNKVHGLGWNDISIVTPYKQQVSQIRQLLSTRPHHFPNNQPDVCTIDAFQGREKSIIIFSCVRALNCDFEISTQVPIQDEKRNHGEQSKSEFSIQANLGFVADIRRMNVAITRARDCLWVVGNAETLQSNHAWKAFIDYAKNERNGTSSFVNIRDYCKKNHLLSDNNERGLSGRTRPIASIISKFFAHVEKRYLQEEKKSLPLHKKTHPSNPMQLKRHQSIDRKHTSCILEDLSSVSSSDHSDTANRSLDTCKKKTQANPVESCLSDLPIKKYNDEQSLTALASLQFTRPHQIPFSTTPSLTLPLQETRYQKASFPKLPSQVAISEKSLPHVNHSLRETVLVAKKTVAYHPNIPMKKIPFISRPHVTEKASTVKKRKRNISDVPFGFNCETTLDNNTLPKTLEAQHQITMKNPPTPIFPALGRSQIFNSRMLSNSLLYAPMKHPKKIQEPHLEYS
jgi:predicted ribonuclease YlaK